MADWFDYQERVAEFFRGLGLEATTNVTIQGARTEHAIDVLVEGRAVAFDFRWIVECKSWKRAVPKEKVLALRTIVDDTGVDRGVLMAEKGHQSGALEAAMLANISLTSLGDLKETLAHEIDITRLRSLLFRSGECSRRYWKIGKWDRIETGLRPDVGANGFIGSAVISAVEFTIQNALIHGFPVVYDRIMSANLAAGGGSGSRYLRVDPTDERAVTTPAALYDILDAELRELESRLDAAERGTGHHR